jgi:4-carboxymuconolactone decarboxylase
MEEVAPKMAEIAADVLFGDIWERPGLSKRDRSMITVAVLMALYRSGQLPGHINRALDNGVTKEELGEIITHVGFYAGVPTAANIAGIAKAVYDERG